MKRVPTIFLYFENSLAASKKYFEKILLPWYHNIQQSNTSENDHCAQLLIFLQWRCPQGGSPGRGRADLGDSSFRVRLTPELNFSAEKLSQLISWDQIEVTEPCFTAGMSASGIKNIVDCPLEVPPFPSHTQSTERCVKLTTEAAANVAGQEARDRYIKSKIKHRHILPKFRTKNDILTTFVWRMFS